MARIVLFILVSLAAYFIASRFWPGLRKRRAATWFAALSVVGLLGWVIPVALGLGVHGNVPVIGMPLKLITATWFITCFVTIVVCGPLSLVQALVDRFKRINRESSPIEKGEVDMGRRGVLKSFGRAVPVAAVATSVGGVANGTERFKLKREEFRIKGLPRALDGFRIGQITDIHVGTFIDPAYVRSAVQAMNAEGVELQVMTGDLIDDLQQLDGTFAALNECQAPHGMLAIHGNHEHWAGLPRIEAKYRQSRDQGGPVRLLVNESVLLEHNGVKVRVVGTDYPHIEMGRSRADVMSKQAQVAFAQAQPDETLLCLAHHPDFFTHAAEKGARLTLAGHTHGGQVAFLGFPAFRFAFKYMLGRYEKEGNHLYVSGGTGHWLPFRIGVPTEVTIVTLRAA